MKKAAFCCLLICPVALALILTSCGQSSGSPQTPTPVFAASPGSINFNANLVIGSLPAITGPTSGDFLPTQLILPVRGGLVPSTTVSNNSTAAVISGSPLLISAGNATGTVTLQAVAQGNATITAATPAGFSTPAGGTQLGVVIQ